MKVFLQIIVLCLLIMPFKSIGQLNSNVDLTKKGGTTLQPLDPPTRKNGTVKVSPSVKTALGEQLTELIAKAKKIRAFEVESFVNEDPIATTLRGFRVLQIEELNKTQMTTIKRILADEATYFISDDVKQCLFLPKMGLEFVNGKDTANVLISFKCDLTRFYQSSNQITIDSDFGHEKLMAFFSDIFKNQPLAVQPMELKQKKERIPEPVFYTVQPGDGWIIVADKASRTFHTKITVDNLNTWNNQNPNALRKRRYLIIGETIIVNWQ